MPLTNIVASNINDAFLKASSELISCGYESKSRGLAYWEIHPVAIEIKNPSHNILFMKGRNGDITTAIVELLWVLAGQDKIDVLKKFLPRAPQFSDNGRTWRAAYGKRIFKYGSKKIDQFHSCYKILRDDLHSRRAVMSIFNPELDYCNSVDIPCSNGVQFLVNSDGKLDLEYRIRSNDIIWGFSHINILEFTVLQCIMANLLKVGIGSFYYYCGSLHTYDLGRLINIYNKNITNRKVGWWDEVCNVSEKYYDVGDLYRMGDLYLNVFKVNSFGTNSWEYWCNNICEGEFISDVVTVITIRMGLDLGIITDKIEAIRRSMSIKNLALRISVLEYLARRFKEMSPTPKEFTNFCPSIKSFILHSWKNEKRSD